MHLNEFADPKDYTPTAAEAETFLKRLLRLWPGRSTDDSAPSVPSQQKTAADRAKETLRRAMNACRRPMCWRKFLLH